MRYKMQFFLILTVLGLLFSSIPVKAEKNNNSFSKTGQAEPSVFVELDVLPAGMLISLNAKDFEMSQSASVNNNNQEKNEKIHSLGFWNPQLRMGVGFNLRPVVLGVSSGVGLIYSSKIVSSYYSTDFSARFKLRKGLSIGPHIGVYRFKEPNWAKDADVDFMDSTAIVGGLVLISGAGPTSFMLHIDRVSGELRVNDTRTGWQANQGAIDVSGLMIGMGVKIRF
jgi:hypothetical protein